MPEVTPREVRTALQLTVDKLKGEGSQRDAVVRALALLGYRRGPTVLAAKLEGDVCRIYGWADTPAGNIMLVTGPAFLPRILDPSEISEAAPGIYVLAGGDTTKAGARASALAQSYQPRAPRAVREAPVRVVPQAPAPRPPPPQMPVTGPMRAKALAKAVEKADLPPPQAPAMPAQQTEAQMVADMLARLLA